MVDWKGVFPAVTTKLNKDGSVDLAATQASIDRLIGAGVSGVIVLPMLGENASLTPAEKEKVIRAAKEAVKGRVPLLSGLCEVATETATDHARKFKAWGAEGLMLFPCLGYKSDPRETAEWYRTIGAASDLPIMIYNNPIAYGVDVTPPVLKDLADCPTIVAVKDEAGDVRRVTDMIIELGDRYRIFCGVDDQVVESVALGSIGWVSGMTNAWPEECVQIFNAAREGRLAAALELYRIMTPAFHLDTRVKLVQYIKLAEHLTYGAPEWVRAPRLPLAGEERTEAAQIIERTIEQLRERSRRAA